MEVRHNLTGLTQQLAKEDFDVLVKTGHAKNLTVISQTDYVPGELDQLSLPVSTSKKEKPKES